MSSSRPLPPDLATLSRLPELATALAGVAPESVRGYDTVDALRTARRLKNAAAAAEFAWAVEVALRRPGSADTVARLQVPHEHAADEIRAGLGISATAAGKLLSLAWDAVKRLPELHEAMACGGLDEQRAWAFADWTGELSDDHAHAVCADLLPRAVLDAEEQLPTALLIKEIAKAAIALDPTWAERRYSEALRRRRVVGRPNPDGTANLSGQQLAPHRVAAVCGRLDGLARAAKRDGDPRPIDHLRAELFLGMLDGTYEALCDTEIFAALAATRPGTPDRYDPDRDNPDRDNPDRHEAAPDRTAGTDLAPTSGTDGPGADGPTAPDGATASDVAAGRGAGATARAADADSPPARCEPAASAGPAKGRGAESPQAGVHLRIRLTTLLGLDRVPAEIAGWTPVHADYAVDLATLMSAAQWRYALTDDDGRLIGSGLINSRPRGWRSRSVRNQGVVDLLVPAALLRDLVVGPLNGVELVEPEQFRSWHPVLVELAERMRHPKPMPDDSRRRFPGRALRRAVELDKPRCIGVGCGRTALSCEMDHRLDWAKGGRTVAVNLAPGCGRDHRLKTEGGWKLHTWKPGTYRWCTPLGRHYVVTVPRTIVRLPAARSDFWIEDCTEHPDPNAHTDSEGIPWQASQTWHPTGPLPPPAVPLVHASPPPAEDVPPF